MRHFKDVENAENVRGIITFFKMLWPAIGESERYSLSAYAEGE